MSKSINTRYVVLPDTHGELVDRPALECTLRIIEIVKPTGVIHLGDVGEWTSVNHHRYDRIRRPDLPVVADRIRHDARMVLKYVLNPLDEACDRAGVKERHMLQGNHDAWLDHFVEANPDYADCVFDEATGYAFKHIFAWQKRGWVVHPCGKLLKIGHLNFYHGHLYAGVHHTQNHLQKMGVNIVYGHHHDLQIRHVSHADGPKCAYSLGCLKKLDDGSNQWLGRRPTNWAHFCAVVDFYDGGRFSIHPVPIIFGKCTLLGRNEVIDGNKPRPLGKIKRSKSNRPSQWGTK